MTTVEGGMIVTDDEALYRLLVLKRSHGLARELPAEYHDGIRSCHPDIDFRFLFLTDGYNLRNTELAAVLGLRQLARIDDTIRIRNQNYDRFLSMCREYPDALITVDTPGRSSFVLPFLLRDATLRPVLQDRLSAAGIESRPLVSGNLLRQPFLRGYYRAGEYPVADFLHENAFYCGNHQFVDAARLDRLGEIMREVLS
jgi:CDP-6-deoxy-D-xylo-4-hexulose-3-dehydrase